MTDSIQNWFGRAKRPRSVDFEWKDEEIDLLQKMWRENKTRHEISANIKTLFNIDRSPKAVANKASILGLPARARHLLGRDVVDMPIVAIPEAEVAKIDAGAKMRKCLSCAKTFRSEWNGHRICNECKTRSDRDIDEYGIAI